MPSVKRKKMLNNTSASVEHKRDDIYIYSAENKNRIIDIVALVSIVLGTVWMILYCRNGASVKIDEAFYLTIPKRILAGDGLLTDEWHLSQLSSVLLLPFVWSWYLIRGTSEGMYVAFCFLFCLIQGLVCGIVYRMLRRYGFFAICTAISIIPFSVLNYVGLSYNTIGFWSALLLFCVLFKLSEMQSSVYAFVSGILYASLVLCNPFTVFIFPLYCGSSLFFILSKKDKKTPYYLFSKKGFFCFLSGIVLPAVYFFIILFKNSSISTIIRCIPHILNDSEHFVTSDGGIETFSILHFVFNIISNMGVLAFVVMLLFSILSIVLSKKNFSSVFMIVAVLSGAIGVLVYYISPDHTSEMHYLYYLVLLVCGICLYYINGRKHKAVLFIFICGGFLYAICMEASSNLGYFAQVNGYACSLPGVMILLAEYSSRIKNGSTKEKTEGILNEININRICEYAIIGVAVFCAGTSFFGCRANALNFSSDNKVYVNEGFYKGERMSVEQYKIYHTICADISEIDEMADDGDRLLIMGNFPVGYMETDKMNNGSLSGWFIKELQFVSEDKVNRVFGYYDICPDNFPAYIYVPVYEKSQTGDIVSTNPKIDMENYVIRYFEGEIVKLRYGLVLKVSGLKDWYSTND